MGILEGKTAVITGASRGLGKAMAIAFAKEGANLALGARTTSDLDLTAKEAIAAGAPKAIAVETDITNESQVQNLVAQAKEQLGGIDIFVANAGTSYPNLTEKRFREVASYDFDIVEKLFQTNAVGTWLCVKEALGALGEGGQVITIGSETARVLYPGAGVYALTKASVDALTTLAARESAQSGIRVNCLSPGAMIDTNIFGPNGMPEFLKEHGYLEIEEFTPAAVWLASEDSKPLTGAFVVAKDFNERGPEAIKKEFAEAAQKHRR